MRRNIFVETLGTVTFLLLCGPAGASDFSARFSGFQEIGSLGAGGFDLFSRQSPSRFGPQQKSPNAQIPAYLFRLSLFNLDQTGSHLFRQSPCCRGHHRILLLERGQWPAGHPSLPYA